MRTEVTRADALAALRGDEEAISQAILALLHAGPETRTGDVVLRVLAAARNELAELRRTA